MCIGCDFDGTCLVAYGTKRELRMENMENATYITSNFDLSFLDPKFSLTFNFTAIQAQVGLLESQSTISSSHQHPDILLSAPEIPYSGRGSRQATQEAPV